MVTYNHSKYIEQTILSVLIQQTNFDLQLIVSDDNSSDDTVLVINNLIKNHSNGHKVKLITHQENVGMMKNFLSVLQICNGKYIAMCDGDDYWTDPFKLQKQVDFLEANSDFVICYHPVQILMPDGSIQNDFITEGKGIPEETNVYDLAIFGNYIHTPSVVFRNVIQEFPPLFSKSPIGDYFLYMLLAEFGKIKRLLDYMAVYRFGVGALTSNTKEQIDLNFNKALFFIRDSVKNNSIKRILNFRVNHNKFNNFGFHFNSFEDFENLSRIEFLSKSFHIRDLFSAILRKVLRKISN